MDEIITFSLLIWLGGGGHYPLLELLTEFRKQLQSPFLYFEPQFHSVPVRSHHVWEGVERREMPFSLQTAPHYMLLIETGQPIHWRLNSLTFDKLNPIIKQSKSTNANIQFTHHSFASFTIEVLSCYCKWLKLASTWAEVYLHFLGRAELLSINAPWFCIRSSSVF